MLCFPKSARVDIYLCYEIMKSQNEKETQHWKLEKGNIESVKIELSVNVAVDFSKLSSSEDGNRNKN
jgi:hypothetical protein